MSETRASRAQRWCGSLKFNKMLTKKAVPMFCSITVTSSSSSVFSLLQNQTAPTSNSSPRGKTQWCFRRRHERVSRTPLSASVDCCPTLPIPEPSLPLHLSLSLSLSLFLCRFSVISPMILSSSVFLLLSLFTSLPHCFRLAIVCSVSVWNLFRLRYVQVSLSFPSNLSFYWQLHNILRSQCKALNEERQMYFKISLFAVVTSLTSYGLNVVI